MKTLSLSVVLAAAFASPAHGSEPQSAAADASVHVIPALYSPSIVTHSGRQFIARCDDDAFARTRYPEGLAEQCERLLGLWHREAALREHPVGASAPPIPDRNALRFSHMFPKVAAHPAPQQPSRNR